MCITNTGPGSKRPTALALPPEFLANVSGGRSGSSVLVERLAKALPSIRYQPTAQQASNRPGASGVLPTSSSYPSSGTSTKTPQEFPNFSPVPSSPISTAAASPSPLSSTDYSSNTYSSSPSHGKLPLLSRKRSFDAATSAALDVAASVTSSMVWPSEPVQNLQGQNCLINADEPAPVLPPTKKKKKQRRRKPQKPGKTAKMNDRHFVKHDYHDHSHDDPNAPPEEYNTKPTIPSTDNDESKKDTTMPAVKPRRRGGVAVAFPLKLHAMLQRIESDGLSSVIGWQPHGRAFLVKEPERFVKHVMPTYFRQTKLTSFQRQLNLYGFSRLTKGPDNGAYYHELFLKGKPFLCKRMVRTKVKGTGFKAASSPDSEPDFYKMPPVVDESQHSPVPALLCPQSHSGSDESEAEEEEEINRHTHRPASAPKNEAVAAAQRRKDPTKGVTYAAHISLSPNQALQNPPKQQQQQHPPPKLKPLSAPAFFLSPRRYAPQPQQCSVRTAGAPPPTYSAGNATMPFPFNAEPRARSPANQSAPIHCKPYHPRNVGKPYRNPFRVRVVPPPESSLLPAADAFPPPSREAYLPIKQEETAPPQPENTIWSPPHCVSDSDGNHSETSGDDEASRQVLDEVVDELFLHDGKMGIIGTENGAEAENVMLDFVKTWDPEHHLDDTTALEDVIEQDVEDDGFDWNQDVEDDAQLGMMLEKLLA